MIKGIVITMLTMETISDLRTKTISAVRIGIFMIIGIMINILGFNLSIGSMIGGMAIGVVLLIYALVTKESIGYGDGFIFTCLGTFIGVGSNLRLLFFSLSMAAIIGIFIIILKKGNIKTRIPFIPCVLGTYIIMTFIEVIL